MGPDDTLRETAKTLFAAAVKAADPAPALRRHLTDAPLPPLAGGRYILVAVGKAACTMMAEALDHVPARTPVIALAVPLAGIKSGVGGHDPRQ